MELYEYAFWVGMLLISNFFTWRISRGTPDRDMVDAVMKRDEQVVGELNEIIKDKRRESPGLTELAQVYAKAALYDREVESAAVPAPNRLRPALNGNGDPTDDLIPETSEPDDRQP
jgi:hypothetical protein